MQQKNKLTELFADQIPSVKRFNELLAPLLEEERASYLRFSYEQALFNWDEQNLRHQTFLKRLVVHDRQSFLDYLMKHTIMGSLRYELQDPGMLQKLLNVLEGDLTDAKSSWASLIFSYQLAFDNPLKLATLAQYIKKSYPDAGEILDLFSKVKIHNIDGDLGEKEKGKLIVR